MRIQTMKGVGEGGNEDGVEVDSEDGVEVDGEGGDEGGGWGVMKVVV